MTTDQKFDVILARLDQIEERLGAMATTTDVVAAEHAIEESLDVLYDLLADAERQRALDEIRAGTRAARVAG